MFLDRRIGQIAGQSLQIEPTLRLVTPMAVVAVLFEERLTRTGRGCGRFCSRGRTAHHHCDSEPDDETRRESRTAFVIDRKHRNLLAEQLETIILTDQRRFMQSVREAVCQLHCREEVRFFDRCLTRLVTSATKPVIDDFAEESATLNCVCEGAVPDLFWYHRELNQRGHGID